MGDVPFIQAVNGINSDRERGEDWATYIATLTELQKPLSLITLC